MATQNTIEMVLSERPDRLLMAVPGLAPIDARRMANQAVNRARRLMPKATGMAASRLSPAYGIGYFGVKWLDSYVWFNEQGINPFVMRGLAGKTIPMWIDDPTGAERIKNPKAKTRITLSGKPQVLIFRRAAPIGARKTIVKRDRLGNRVVREVPMSYPGAPGRINVREAGAPLTTAGRVAGAIARGNGGVRWRHPGIQPRYFLNQALTETALFNGVLPLRIYVADQNWKAMARG